QPSGRVALRLEKVNDKVDYDACICDGRSVYWYSGMTKTVTEYRLPKPDADRPEANKRPAPPVAATPSERAMERAIADWYAFLARHMQPAEQLPFRLLS